MASEPGRGPEPPGGASSRTLKMEETSTVVNGDVVWTKALGWADLEKR